VYRQRTHLSVFLVAQDAMWAPTVKFATITLVNQADASNSYSHGQSQ
jgi:hypothetical protein